jgi:lipopolysaccharide/colanic/teichoic acid biosynthesis glycosyltransferase
MTPTQAKRALEAGKDAVKLHQSSHIFTSLGLTEGRERLVFDEASFQRMIALERKRSERSRKPVLLMLIDVGNFLPSEKSGTALADILAALSSSTRDTDVTGWYKSNAVVGVMFTEINMDDPRAILATMMNRVSQTLRQSLTVQKFCQLTISWHLFPEEWNQENLTGNPTLYPDILHREKKQRLALALKRAIDIVGSLFAILFFAPLFLLVGALVKIGSKGPVLFKQERIGQFGKPFTFIKFRSMYANNDPKIHREFMKRVISGDHKDGSKMENDPRITRVGRFLRKSSLDELPQFFTVLKGDMSLVGPRPPLAYEVQEYDIWHRRRVLEVKPGITGLWQVKGRSRLRFDDMVRLDLQYVNTWSLWNDILILVKTPFAVILGGDAY